MKKALLVAIALVVLAWAVPLGPPKALAAAAGVEVTAPVATREGGITGPTVDVDVTAPSSHAAVEVMVSDIDLVFDDPRLLTPPDPLIEIKVCTEDELPCTDS